jgi:hypothetical protein
MKLSERQSVVEYFFLAEREQIEPLLPSRGREEAAS